MRSVSMACAPLATCVSYQMEGNETSLHFVAMIFHVGSVLFLFCMVLRTFLTFAHSGQRIHVCEK